MPQDGTPAAPRKATAFSLYIKQHFASTKDANPQTPHKQLMTLLAQQYQASKQTSVSADDDAAAHHGSNSTD